MLPIGLNSFSVLSFSWFPNVCKLFFYYGRSRSQGVISSITNCLCVSWLHRAPNSFVLLWNLAQMHLSVCWVYRGPVFENYSLHRWQSNDLMFKFFALSPGLVLEVTLIWGGRFSPLTLQGPSLLGIWPQVAESYPADSKYQSGSACPMG